ncbi:MAG: hypothetical protein JOY63_01825, partial [Acetobacteraceae bacterium]|nr:hypothetical protein [Acetobacteraceae bacterium]
MTHLPLARPLLLAAALLCGAAPASARNLSVIKNAGTVRLCAHPNSLPFASKT